MNGKRTFIFEIAILEAVVYGFDKVIKAAHDLLRRSMSRWFCSKRRGHTPLDCFEDTGLERLGKTGVQGASLLTLTFYCLEIVQTTFTGDFTLELPEAIEGHACSEGPEKKR